MAQIKNPKGNLTLELDDALAPPEGAGEFTELEIKRMYKPRKGVGLVAEHCADRIEELGAELSLPDKFAPDRLRSLGHRSEAIDDVIADVERFLKVLKQSNTVFDAECGKDLLELRDYIDTMSRNKPSLRDTFKTLFDYYKFNK